MIVNVLAWIHIPDDEPASVAQLDTRTTCDQKVAGLTPGSATFFCGDLRMKCFVRYSSLIQEGQLSVSEERMYTILVNRFGDKN